MMLLQFRGKAPFLLTNALLTLLLTAGALLCLDTAMDLRASHLLILVVLGTLCLVAQLVSRSKHGLSVLWVALLAVAIFFLRFREEGLWHSIARVYDRIVTVYQGAYDLDLPLVGNGTGDSTLILVLLGWVLVLTTLGTLNRGYSVLLALAADALPVVLCFVVTDTPPSDFWLFGWMGALLVTLLTQSLRRRHPEQAWKLTWAALGPVLALVLLVQALIPRQDYMRSPFGQQVLAKVTDLSYRLTHLDVQDVFGPVNLHVPVTHTESLNVGPRNYGRESVMEVKSYYGEPVYLRGMAYCTYTGSSWELPDPELYSRQPDPEYTQGLLSQQQGAATANLYVRTRFVENVIFTPYYMTKLPEVGQVWHDVCIENQDSLREYTLSYERGIQIPQGEVDMSLLTRSQANPDQNFVFFYTAPINQIPGSMTALSSPESSSGGIRTDETDGQSIAGVRFPEPAQRLDPIPERALTDYDQFVQTYYTQLPDATFQAARERLAHWDVNDGMSREDVVATLLYQVQRSAQYDLNTPRMPEGADFAIWFLEESETGYCVHFASAMTVLLRAAGIPARYVTGYLVNPDPGQWTELGQRNAHAWTEYYLPDLGWVPVEPTPGAGVDATAAPLGWETHPTEEPTDPTEEPTEPGETTRPTDEPTVPTSLTEEPEPTDHATEPTVPGGNLALDPGDGTPVEIPAWLWKGPLIALVLAGGLWLWRPLVLALRRHRERGLESRQRYLRQWRRLCRSAEKLKLLPELEEQAQQALFGPREPSEADWLALNQWEASLNQELNRQQLPRRLLWRRLLVRL